MPIGFTQNDSRSAVATRAYQGRMNAFGGKYVKNQDSITLP